ncbi:hypothetical protein [Pedococcus soli]
MDTRTLLIRCAALLSVGAALIHVGVSADHFREWWAAGLFFLVTAAAQLAWAAWLWARPASRRVLAVGAAGSVALVLLWVVSRTSGLPIGPEAGVAEAVGAADVVCGILELACAGLALVASAGLVPRRLRTPSTPRRAALVTGAVAAVALVASGAAIAAPGHDHTEETAAAGHTHASGAATSESGAHDHADVPDLPDTSKATSEQTAAAKELLDRTIAATTAYRDPAAATKAGFDVQAAWDREEELVAKVAQQRAAAGASTKPGKAGKAARKDGRRNALGVGLVHVPNKANRTDGRILDPNAPETLIYSRSADGTFRLVGVMFTAEKKTPPASYQPYVRWHTHETCTGGGVKKLKPVDGRCASGTTLRTSGAMTHLWFVDDSQLASAYARKAPVKALVAYQKALA